MSRRDRRGGAVLLEMALALPIVVVLIIAAVDFARVACARATALRAIDDTLNYATQWRSAGEFPSAANVVAHFRGAILPPLSPGDVQVSSLTLGGGTSGAQTSANIEVTIAVRLYTPVLSAAFPGSTLNLVLRSRMAYPSTSSGIKHPPGVDDDDDDAPGGGQ